MKIAVLAFLLVVLGSRQVAAADLGDYRRDVDSYRTAYAMFEVKKGAFDLTKTFALEEELIQAAQNMLLHRADVWTSYWQLLDMRVAALTQMPDESKKKIRDDLAVEIAALNAHKARLTQVKTRLELSKEAMVLNAEYGKYQSLAFLVNAELSVGNVFQAAQSLVKFNNNVTERVQQQQLSEAEKTIRLRGLAVNLERINQAIEALGSARAMLLAGSSNVSNESFTHIAQVVNPLYLEVNQQLQTAVELAKGVEW